MRNPLLFCLLLVLAGCAGGGEWCAYGTNLRPCYPEHQDRRLIIFQPVTEEFHCE